MTMHPMPRTQEIERHTTSGYTMLAVGLVLIAAGIFFIVGMASAGPRALFLAVPLILLGAFVLAGLYMLQPNEGAILLLFGAYTGTDRTEGLRWANPFYKKQKISLRAHNLASERLKVNDLRGNPIEIAAVVVWRVRDTAQALLRRRGLRSIRRSPERVGGAAPGQRLPLRRERDRGRRDHAARRHRRRRRSAAARTAGAARQGRRRGARGAGSRTWPTRPRSPR
ncbi:MAG: SPFH domain-containing protein [Burkholderiaceae bacterium]|nr:SPFH domain-containing protein [Burkholderiaceae bacterium]